MFLFLNYNDNLLIQMFPVVNHFSPNKQQTNRLSARNTQKLFQVHTYSTKDIDFKLEVYLDTFIYMQLALGSRCFYFYPFYFRQQ